MNRGWRVVVAYALVGAATQLVWLTYAPVTTGAADRFGVSETAVGWLANVFPLLYLPLALPAGRLLDHRFRLWLTLGALLTAAGAVVRLVDDGYAWAILGQLAAAVAQPFVLNAVTGVAGRYLPVQDRAKGIAVGTASTFAGMILAFLVGAVLTDPAQLQLLAGLGAGFAVAAALLLTWALRSVTPAHTPTRHAVAVASLRQLAADPVVRRLVGIVFFPFGTFVALSTFGQPLLEPAGVDADTASLILLVNVIIGVGACAVVPVWAAKRRSELVTMTAALGVSAAACLLLALEPGVVTGFISLALIGLLLLPCLPIVLEMVERRTGESANTGAALIWLSGNLGGLVVAGGVGFLLDVPSLGFVLCALASVAAIPVVASLGRALTRTAADAIRG